jgi:hypothetical protein
MDSGAPFRMRLALGSTIHLGGRQATALNLHAPYSCSRLTRRSTLSCAGHDSAWPPQPLLRARPLIPFLAALHGW